MVRTPSLPASVFSDFVQFEGNDVENFLQQTPFRDFMDKSILLSSRELYSEICRVAPKKAKQEI